MENITRLTSFSSFIITFCRFLRSHEFIIGPLEEKEAFRAISFLSLNSKEILRSTLKSTLVKNHKQYLNFDNLFKVFWEKYVEGIDSKQKERPDLQKNNKNNATSLESLKNWLYKGKSDENINIASYSYSQVKNGKPVKNITEDDLPELRKLIKVYVDKLAQSHNRRKVISTRGRRLAIRNIIRAGLRNGGEILRLYYRIPKKKEPKLFLICDVSRSMDIYSIFLLKFVYAFQHTFRQVEAFLFSAELIRVSKYLQESTIDAAISKITEHFAGWSGGTRIGECLDQFITNFARKIDKTSLVMILSDGIDQGDSDLIGKAIKKMHRKSGRIIWFNPLAGNPGYKPETRAMKAVLPYIDELTPLHDIESFRSIITIKS